MSADNGMCVQIHNIVYHDNQPHKIRICLNYITFFFGKTVGELVKMW